MFDLLPKEVCDDIFLRLPIENLICLACTCNTLLKFMINPDFMNAHDKKSKDNPFILLRYVKDRLFIRDFLKTREKEYFCLRQDNESFSGDGLRMLGFPIEDRFNRCFNIVGSCNGVVCLSDDLRIYSGIIYLWNPSIRRYKELPCPNLDVGLHGPYDLCVGFGFDQFTNDYKVVRLAYLKTDEITRFPEPPVIEVYSLKSDSWKTIEASGPLYSIRNSDPDITTCKEAYSQCFLNGAVHWAGYKEYERCWITIVTFDVHQECFGEIKLPACLVGLSARFNTLHVAICKDRLALVQMPQPYTFKNSLGCIWVMEEYGNVDSWSMLIRFDAWRYSVPRSFFFRRNNDILSLVNFWHEGKSAPRVLAMRVGRDQDEVLGSLEGPAKGFYLGLYQEGLALFNEGKAIPRVADDDSDFGCVEDESYDYESESASED